MSEKAAIYLCDDETDVRGGLGFHMRLAGFDVFDFASGTELLEHIEVQSKPFRGVFLLDLNMPPMDGDVLHDVLIERGYARTCPVIFLSGRGTIARAVTAVNKGALSFIEKPCPSEALLPLLKRAFEMESQWFAQTQRCDFLRFMWESLSAQQRKVALLVAAGDLNKTIAAKLEIVERTVEMHRAKSFEKLGVNSPAALATTIAAMKSCGIDVGCVDPDQATMD